jgi:[acyl-carrier-protein] S-malonyltransferase
MKQAGERQPGGMAALIGLDRDTVEAICETAQRQSGQYVGIANDNCPGQLVISGAVAALALAMESAREKGAKRVIRLAVSIAAHSPLMEESAHLFRQELNMAPIRPPDCSFVANATARPVIEPDSIREALGRQLTSPVLWTQSIGWMIEKGMTRAVEVGPGSVLAGLVRRIDRGVERTNVEEMLAS